LAGQSLPQYRSRRRLRELERALGHIGVTRAHKLILLLILLGAPFDSFEQNTVGIAGPALRAQWQLSAGDIGFLNTITFASSALGRSMEDVRLTAEPEQDQPTAT
jgi:hypothetical protein